MENQLTLVFDGDIAGDCVQLCDARTLHGYMEVKRDFSNWIKARITKFGFVEGVDYLLAKFGEQLPSGTKYSIDYHITLDMAKELSMVENSAKGREARRYFIAMERRAIDAIRAGISGELYARALDAEKREAASFALASSAGKNLAKRRKEKKMLTEIICLLREEVQLKLMIGRMDAIKSTGA